MKWGLVLAVGVGLAVPASSARGLEVEVAAPGETLSADSLSAGVSLGDTLVASFRLQEIFGEGSTLGDGIPATLILVVDLWRDRGSWWDSLVRSQAFTYRFRRDIWTGEVELWNIDRTRSVLSDRDALATFLERVHEIVLGVPENFTPKKRYYVTVRVMIQPMSMDDLESVDAWLSGDVTQGGGLLGIPKALARILVDVSGLGDQTTEGKSRSFVPRP
jgi:hypothetical protein